MESAALIERLRPWLRETHAPAYDAALEWLLPRCRTEEERALAPALLLLLSPLNALVVPCRPAAGSCVNFQVTLSRAGTEGPERVRLTVRAGSGVQAFRRSGVQAFGRSGVQAVGRSDAQAPGDPTDRTDPSDPERLNARTPQRLTMWLDAGAVIGDPLAAGARVLAALLVAQDG